MESTEYRYDAFISYKHQPKDKKIAESLMTLLEKMEKPDKTKLHIFRDQNELPTSSNLGDDIHEALKSSRFLIVLGSPDYLQSKWCMEEVSFFRSLHNNTNDAILPILIEGEPKESLPSELFFESVVFTDESGKDNFVQQEIEPLCADVRADSIKASVKKLRNTEYLRIAAPILGCQFDDLYNRALRQRNRIYAVIGFSIASAVLAFAVYSSLMFRQISNRQKAIYVSEALRLGNEALEYANSDPGLAMLLAEAALPENPEKPDYTPPQEAETALCSAVLQEKVESSTQYFSTNAKIYLGSPQNWEIRNVFPEYDCFTVYKNGHTFLYDLITGALLLDVEGDSGEVSSDGSRFAVAIRLQPGYYDEVDGYTGSIYRVDCYDIRSAQLISSQAVSVDVDHLLFENGSNDCYVMALDSAEETFICAGVLSENGTWVEGGNVPEEAEAHYQERSENFNYSVGNSTFKPITYWNRTLSETELQAGMELQSSIEGFHGYDICEEDVEGYSFTNDGEMLLFYSESDIFMSGYDGKYCTYFYSTSEHKVLKEMKGFAFVCGKQGILLLVEPDGLTILSYHPDNFSNDFSKGQEIQISDKDHNMIMNLQYSPPFEGMFNISAELFWKDEAGGETVSKDDFEAVVSNADLSTVAALDMDGKLMIFENGKYQGDLETANTGKLCIDSTGTRLACADIDSGNVQIWDLKTNTLLFEKEFDIDACDLQMEGDYLLLNNGFSHALLWNWKKDCEVVKAALKTSATYYYSGEIFQDAFYDDGLVFVHGAGLGYIYDLNTGKEVSFYNPALNLHANTDFIYDCETGTLVVQNGDVFIVERRNENGDFEKELVIQTAYSEMYLLSGLVPESLRSLTDQYLVINNGSVCEIYDIYNGNLLYRIMDDSGNALYTMSGDMIMDLRLPSGETGMVCSLPSVEEAQNELKRFLTSSWGRRLLNEEECRKNYIPEEWQKKGK